jgi:hypothetical protein
VRHIARVTSSQYGQSWHRNRVHAVLRNRFYLDPPPGLKVVPQALVAKSLRGLHSRTGPAPA